MLVSLFSWPNTSPFVLWKALRLKCTVVGRTRQALVPLWNKSTFHDIGENPDSLRLTDSGEVCVRPKRTSLSEVAQP